MSAVPHSDGRLCGDLLVLGAEQKYGEMAYRI